VSKAAESDISACALAGIKQVSLATSPILVGRWLALVICLGFAGVGILTLQSGPPLWFDEGWVLTVARDWTETGYYGEHLLGRVNSASMMNVGFPAVLPIGFSFSIFGIGIWQGRLPSLLFTLASLYLVFYLTSRLANRTAGYLALVGLIVTSTAFHPLIWGKQALGENAAIFLFLAGFALFLVQGRGSSAASVLAAASWGAACITKMQFLPFLTAAFVAPLLLALYQRRTATAKLMGICLGGTWLAYLVFLQIQETLVGQEMLKQQGLYSSSAFAPLLSLRGPAFIIALTYGLPSILSLYAAVRAFGKKLVVDLSRRESLTRLAILVFAVSWLLWYLLLSVAWARYLYPLVFVSSIFLGQFLSDLIFGSVEGNSTFSRIPRLPRVLLAAGLILGLGVQTGRGLAASLSYGNSSLIQVVEFLNSKPQAKVIESYDMEVFFFLPNEKRHHPPDAVQLQVNRRAFLKEQVEIDYDPLAVDPDLLVVGHQSRLWGLYKGAVKSGNFVPVKRIGVYEIYERVREGEQRGAPVAAQMKVQR